MYVPKDHYLWDFWLISWQGKHHLFYLQAPRDLPDPEMRHKLATVGHAISTDLRHWDYLGIALAPGSRGTWDDRAIWTGSIIAWKNKFYMLYTGTNIEEGGKIQRIGLASSNDLNDWIKHPANPIIEADLELYEDKTSSPFSERAWRDPYVIYKKSERMFYAFITARAKGKTCRSYGCIALARSSDLLKWEILPPVSAPQIFMQMEIPQYIAYRGRHYLLFSADKGWITNQVKLPHTIVRKTGTYFMTSANFYGPYSHPRLLLGDKIGYYYGAKVIQISAKNWVVLAWIGRDDTGTFIGGLSDPMRVYFHSDGSLAVV